MITLRAFTKDDLSKLLIRENERLINLEGIDSALFTSLGNYHSFVVEDKVAAIVGASCLWEGVWQVAAITSDLIRGYGVYFTKGCLTILNESAKAFRVKRYNAIVDSSNVEYIRWLNLLGFEYEYVMRNALPNNTDVFGYVKPMKGY